MPEATASSRVVLPRSVAVWAARLFLALAFVAAGAVKIPSEGSMWVRLFESIGAGQWFRYFTAVVEIAGGLLMLVPRLTLPAVFLCASAMVGALLTHALLVGFGPPTVVVTVLLALTLFVGRSHGRGRVD